MTNSLIKEFLKRPIAYQPVVAKAFGSVKLAILWCQFYYWMDKGENEDGWIYKTMDQVFEETGLTRKPQESARKLGNQLGVLESKVMGAPATVHFRVNLDVAEEIISKYVNKGKIPKLFEEPKPKTNGDLIKEFFEEGECFDKTRQMLIEKIGERATDEVLKEFILYWTEPTKSGKKVRWEGEKHFDIKRRLITWLRNKKQFSRGSNGEKKGVVI